MAEDFLASEQMEAEEKAMKEMDDTTYGPDRFDEYEDYDATEERLSASFVLSQGGREDAI